MKVGDLVSRQLEGLPPWKLEPAIEQFERLGHGIVVSKHISGKPPHPCISVYYPKVREIYDIGESLMEVVNESR